MKDRRKVIWLGIRNSPASHWLRNGSWGQLKMLLFCSIFRQPFSYDISNFVTMHKICEREFLKNSLFTLW